MRGSAPEIKPVCAPLMPWATFDQPLGAVRPRTPMGINFALSPPSPRRRILFFQYGQCTINPYPAFPPIPILRKGAPVILPDMTYRPARHIVSLVRFWWDAIGYLAGSAQARLGLYPVPVRPFLPRKTHGEIRNLLAFLEPVLRRVFFLQALELGPLPAPAPGTAQTQTDPTGPASAPSRPAFPIPHFRLTEPQDGLKRASTPPPPAFRTGPRIRFLDEDTAIDLRDYPSTPDDLIASGPLVRRLLAINHALDNAALYLAKMRRLLSGPSRPVQRLDPAVFYARHLKHLQQDAALALHDETAELRWPNTS